MLMSLMCSCLHEEFTCITILSINGWTLKSLVVCIYVPSIRPPTYINDRLANFIPKTCINDGVEHHACHFI